MTILESNDNELRQLIFEKDKVIVKFTANDCQICKQMSPTFKTLSEDPAFSHITFVRMGAHENPVSSQEVKMTGTPFFATYRNSTLLDCGVVSTEKELRNMLTKLL